MQRKKILVIDDQPSNIDIMRVIFAEDEVYKLIATLDGAKGIKLAKDHSPDIIITDYMMPEMSGLDVIDKLKNEEKTENIPVIMMAASDDSNVEERALALGAIDFIKKPLDISVVKARIKNYIRMKERFDQLEEFAFIDSKTGIWNARAYENRIDEEWNRERRWDKPLSLIMFDIDNFKFFNDEYGHGAGDECLYKVAQALKSTVTRAADFVARYGGEELVVLLPDLSFEEAKSMAEELRASVEDLQIPHEKTQAKNVKVVTCSMGLVTVTPGEHITIKEFKDIADEKLYESKYQGKNRVSSINLDEEKFEGKEFKTVEMQEEYFAEKITHLLPPELNKHMQRVTQYASKLAELYGMQRDDLAVLQYVTKVHDAGMMQIPDFVVYKPEKLSDDEHTVMRSHTEIGYEMLNDKSSNASAIAATVAMQHHEKWDGSGYPKGLKGEEIDFFARIVAIADVLDALKSEKSYKSAWSNEEVIHFFQEERGRHFDPELTDLFLSNSGDL